MRTRGARHAILSLILPAAALLAAGCGGGAGASTSRAPAAADARKPATSVAGTLHTAAQVLHAFRSHGFHVRRYDVSGRDASRFFSRRHIPVSIAVVDSGMLRSVIATPKPDRGSVLLAYVAHDSNEGMRIWQQNGEFTDPQRLPGPRYMPKLSVRGNVVAIYFPPQRHGPPGPNRRAQFQAAMDRLAG